jgi:hypothetical protein
VPPGRNTLLAKQRRSAYELRNGTRIWIITEPIASDNYPAA